MALYIKTLVDAEIGKPEPKRKKYEILMRKVMYVVPGYANEQDNMKYLRKIANIQ